jgi:hypothetical protein
MAHRLPQASGRGSGAVAEAVGVRGEGGVCQGQEGLGTSVQLRLWPFGACAINACFYSRCDFDFPTVPLVPSKLWIVRQKLHSRPIRGDPPHPSEQGVSSPFLFCLVVFRLFSDCFPMSFSCGFYF